MLIAQIGDFHLRPIGQTAYAGIDTHTMTRRAIDTIAALDPAPDCVLVTGDLADGGRPEEYALAADLLSRLSMPVFVIPGNHDRRETMRDCLAGTYPYLLQDEDFLHYVVEDFSVLLGGKKSRHENVHAHFLRGPFTREIQGEIVHGGLGRRIGKDARERHHSRHRTEIND